ncbi:MAG TPA: dTDP-4-dehydrorhamnose 3,5-epimerase [Pseudomonadales bacterium]|nr:dTDP-4-dehydrorhamnose 3,5-epimerase [Pseudomonadales bacterium]
MARFDLQTTPLQGVVVVQRHVVGDDRGRFSRLFCAEELRPAGWTGPIAQINHSLTAVPGTVRGMHFQRPPHAEMKLVTCIRGRVWDVAVDLRPGSPTRLRWHGVELSAEAGNALLVPEGFAHGFQVLEADSELLYMHSAPYAPAAEGGLNPLDPALAIDWPITPDRLSEKDRSRPMVDSMMEDFYP